MTTRIGENRAFLRSVRELDVLLAKGRRRLAASAEHTVTLRLGKDDVIYERLSNYSDKRIKSEIIDYIERQARFLPLKERLVIRIERPDGQAGLAESVGEAIRDNLRDRMIECQLQLRGNLREFLALFALGVSSFAVKAAIGGRTTNPTVSEILIIVSWVFIWRSVETIYFERKKLRREKLKLIQLYLATYEERILG